MSDILLGVIFSAIGIVIFELFAKADKKLIGALTLTGIAYIYIGFNWFVLFPLAVVSISITIFTILSYVGYKRDPRLISLGLLLHGGWDLLCPYIKVAAPEGYDIFCLVVDVILAVYFYFRLRKEYGKPVI